MKNLQDKSMLDKTDKSINKELEINFFVKHKTIKETILFEFENFSLTLDDIYSYIKNKHDPFKIYLKDFFNLELNVFFINNVSFSFEINGIVGEYILRKPIIYKTRDDYYEFIALKQINLFLEGFHIPMIKCNKTNDKIKPTFLNLKIHLAHEDKIIECF